MASHIVDLDNDDGSDDEEVVLDIGKGAVAGGVAEESATEQEQEHTHEQQEDNGLPPSDQSKADVPGKAKDTLVQIDKDLVRDIVAAGYAVTENDDTTVTAPEGAHPADHADEDNAEATADETLERLLRSPPGISAPTTYSSNDTLPPIRSADATLNVLEPHQEAALPPVTEPLQGKEDLWSSPLPSKTQFTLASEHRRTLGRIGMLLPSSSAKAFEKWKIARLNCIIRRVDVYSEKERDAKIIIDDLMLCMTKTIWSGTVLFSKYGGKIMDFLYEIRDGPRKAAVKLA
ncbi:hypothetical protein E8E11_008776 [Didymella keratinophila]|nr:hypothetical protein E8E11_008776 [Didymella keratinophila]